MSAIEVVYSERVYLTMNWVRQYMGDHPGVTVDDAIEAGRQFTQRDVKYIGSTSERAYQARTRYRLDRNGTWRRQDGEKLDFMPIGGLSHLPPGWKGPTVLNIDGYLTPGWEGATVTKYVALVCVEYFLYWKFYRLRNKKCPPWPGRSDYREIAIAALMWTRRLHSEWVWLIDEAVK